MKETDFAAESKDFDDPGSKDLFFLEVMGAYNRFIVEFVENATHKTGVTPNRVVDRGWRHRHANGLF
jgi:hypothetical protein